MSRCSHLIITALVMRTTRIELSHVTVTDRIGYSGQGTSLHPGEVRRMSDRFRLVVSC